MFQFPLGHLRYAMIHKTGIVPSGTNENSDHHGDRPARRKIRDHRYGDQHDVEEH
jgi:hypothetical protein